MRLSTSVTHRADPQRTFAMLCDPAYQAERAVRTGATHQTVTVEEGPEEGVTTVTTSRQLPSAGLPDLARRVLGPQLAVVETVRWGPADADGEREGAVGVEVPGVPVTFTGGMHLRRGAGPGTTEQVLDGELQAAIPLLGRKVEQLVADQVRSASAVEEQLSAQWLARG